MAAIVPPLDMSRAYEYCPQCSKQGTKVELKREMHKFICPFGHVFERAQLEMMGAEMIKTSIQEQPNPLAVKWPIWVMPRIKAALEEKFAGRINVTMATVCEALADDEAIFISGPDAAHLRKLGLTKGADIVAAIRAAKQMELENQELQKQINQLGPILRAAGISL